MRGGVGAVERNRNALDAGVLDLLGDVLGHQGSVGRQRGANAAAGGVLRELENVVTVKRLAAAEHQDGIGELGNLRNDVQGFAGRQVGRRHQLRRGGAAVDAAQVAAFGDLPEDQPRFVFLLACRMGAAWCHDCFSSPPLRNYGSFLCFQDRIPATQGAVSLITGGCDGRHFWEQPSAISSQPSALCSQQRDLPGDEQEVLSTTRPPDP